MRIALPQESAIDRCGAWFAGPAPGQRPGLRRLPRHAETGVPTWPAGARIITDDYIRPVPPVSAAPPPVPVAQNTLVAAARLPKPQSENKGDDAVRTKHSNRPKELADWKRDDYYNARREGNPQLVMAVAYLGGHFAGKPSAAELLIRLLEAPSAGGGPDAARRGGRGTDANLMEAIVAALAVNGTPLAWQTIDQLASENLKTSDNQAAAAAALKTLLSRPSQDNEDSLLRAVALAGQPRPAGRDSADVKKQHDILVDLLKSSASTSLRLRLANYMIVPETPQTWYDQLWTFLQDPRPENLAAQNVLYRSDRPDAAAKRLLEQRLIAGSGAAVGRLLGTIPPPERQPAGGTMAAADPYAVAEQIWNPSLASAIERRLAVIDSLEQGASLLLLASTIPGERLRAAVVRTFKMHREEDPKPLEAARAAEKIIPEPGFLLAAKVLPRKDAAALGGGNGPDRGGVPHAPAGKGPKTPKTAKAKALREAKQQREHITQQWLKFAENLLRAMCQQFRAAAGTPAEGSSPAGAGSDAKDVPLKLHSPADVVAAYRADWPEGLAGKPAGLAISPLRVRYVRIEQQARPLTVLAYYRRQLPDCEEHRIEQGIWLDAMSATGEGGAARSVDVLITKANKNLPALADQEQRIIVEVLAIECAGIAAKSVAAIGK